MKALIIIIALIFFSLKDIAQNKINTDSIMQYVLLDLAKGKKPDLTGVDTLWLINKICERKNLTNNLNYSKYLSNVLKKYNPSSDATMTMTGGLLPEKISNRSLRFVCLFYCYSLVYNNRFKDSLTTVYISYENNSNTKYITEDIFHTQKDYNLANYIFDKKSLNKHFKKILKYYKKWVAKIEMDGISKVRINKIEPFVGTKYKWGFENIPLN